MPVYKRCGRCNRFYVAGTRHACAGAAPRPSTAARGYGAAHRHERARWKRHVDAGLASCVRCGLPIDPGSKWHLDHTADRTGYLGVSHEGCNVAAANRSRASSASLPPQRRTSRQW